MRDQVNRRSFLLAAAAMAAVPAAARAQNEPRRNAGGPMGEPPIAIASGNGLAAVEQAVRRMRAGEDPLDAAVEGVRIVEDDPEDMSVGLGGLPNEHGVVELDASVMHGPRHRSGAVASLRNIRNPAAVAREVARRTDHCMLVGAGALEFARQMGFEEENLLTEKARRAWLEWKSRQNPDDDWLDPDQLDLPTKDGHASRDVMHTTGTIHLSALTAGGDLAGVTTTSGLSWKIPGRIGDSPIIGAGNYTDNAVGSAGATGRGEAVIQICGARTIVERMAQGDHPTDACLYALQMIADKTTSPRLLERRGRPNFSVVFYAVRKDGAYGSACMRGRREFALADTQGARLLECPALLDG